MRGGCARDRGSGWLSGSGRQVDRQGRGGEGRSAAGWLLSVDGYCRCIDLSTGEEERGKRGREGEREWEGERVTKHSSALR